MPYHCDVANNFGAIFTILQGRSSDRLIGKYLLSNSMIVTQYSVALARLFIGILLISAAGCTSSTAVDSNNTQDSNSANTPLENEADETMMFLFDLVGPPYGSLPAVTNVVLSSPKDPLDVFPDDCLRVTGGPLYCFSKETRLLMAVESTSVPDADQTVPMWAFNLPGDNTTNRIDGVTLGEAYSLVLAANITTAFGYPKFEYSAFHASGTFNGTYEILETGTSLEGISTFGFADDNPVMPAVNIQAEPLIISSTVSYNPFSEQGWTTCFIGNTYTLNAGGQRSNPNDWAHSGVMVAGVDPTADQTSYRSIRHYPDVLINDRSQVSIKNSELRCGATVTTGDGETVQLSINDGR